MSVVPRPAWKDGLCGSARSNVGPFGERGRNLSAPFGPASPEAWGVCRGYWDISGNYRVVPDATVQAVLAAMGAAGPGPPPDAPLLTVDAGGPWPDLPSGRLELEGGGTVEMAPPQLPLGYHR